MGIIIGSVVWLASAPAICATGTQTDSTGDNPYNTQLLDGVQELACQSSEWLGFDRVDTMSAKAVHLTNQTTIIPESWVETTNIHNQTTHTYNTSLDGCSLFVDRSASDGHLIVAMGFGCATEHGGSTLGYNFTTNQFDVYEIRPTNFTYVSYHLTDCDVNLSHTADLPHNLLFNGHVDIEARCDLDVEAQERAVAEVCQRLQNYLDMAFLYGVEDSLDKHEAEYYQQYCLE